MTWWKYIQEERDKMGKNSFANWKALVENVKEQYLLEDYEIQSHKKRESLKKKLMDVENYTKQFQKLCLRSRVQEDETIKVTRYLGGLKQNIQEDINLWSPKKVNK